MIYRISEREKKIQEEIRKQAKEGMFGDIICISLSNYYGELYLRKQKNKKGKQKYFLGLSCYDGTSEVEIDEKTYIVIFEGLPLDEFDQKLYYRDNNKDKWKKRKK